jgi:hypothetical protein
MNPKALARRVDVGLVAAIAASAAVVAGLLAHFGLPLWLLPAGASPVAAMGVARWLVYRHANYYAAEQWAIDADRLHAAEHAITGLQHTLTAAAFGGANGTAVHSGVRR